MVHVYGYITMVTKKWDQESDKYIMMATSECVCPNNNYTHNQEREGQLVG